MDERLEQMRSEREAWRALSNEDRAKLRGKYTWWRAEDFLNGAAELEKAFGDGDLSRCRVEQHDGFRIDRKGNERRVKWICAAVNEKGEMLGAFDISYDCPPECPEEFE